MFGILFPFTTAGQPAFIDDLRCMPVLIQIPLTNGTSSNYGTGVYLSESNHLFLVTAAHCIFNPSSTNALELINSNAFLSSLARETNVTARAVLFLDLQKLAQNGKIKRHQSHDVAVIDLGAYASTNDSSRLSVALNLGATTSTTSSFPTPWDAQELCKTFANVSVGSDSYVLGYPVNLLKALPNGQHPEIDFTSPLVRKGIISQKNNFTQKLIIDSAVFGGNSGGPVLIVEHPNLGQLRFSMVGIIIQYIPAEASVELRTSTSPTASIIVNSGYGVAEPVDYALELIQQFDLHK